MGKLEKYLNRLQSGVEFQAEFVPSLNRLIGGFERKKLVVIGARPSECKSTLALQMAYYFSSNFKILYLSLEMTEEESLFRLYCHEENIENVLFFKGLPKGESYSESFNSFKEKFSKHERSLIVGEQIGKTWEEVDTLLQDFNNERPDMVFLDYIQCIATRGKKIDAIEDYIKKFRAMAIEKNFCLFIVSQINRQNISETREPSMEGLKSTGFLEEHADKVILLHYPCKHSLEQSSDKLKIIVAKNKNGRTGFVWSHINPGTYTISEAQE